MVAGDRGGWPLEEQSLIIMVVWLVPVFPLGPRFYGGGCDGSLYGVVVVGLRISLYHVP